jgi:NADPH:quinone reductase-like Zn-dependent oxidoreductase
MLDVVQVLVSMRAAVVNPADLYNIQMGGLHTADGGGLTPPFVAGSDGLAVVVKVSL